MMEKKNLSSEELEKVAGGMRLENAWQCTVCGTLYRNADPPASCKVCGNNDRRKFDPTIVKG